MLAHRRPIERMRTRSRRKGLNNLLFMYTPRRNVCTINCCDVHRALNRHFPACTYIRYNRYYMSIYLGIGIGGTYLGPAADHRLPRRRRL